MAQILSAFNLHADIENEFASAVANGLACPPKNIPSKYFYNSRGSELFQQITELPEYYLPRCEVEILKKHADDIADLISGESLNLFELGCGMGDKVNHLLNSFVRRGIDVRYRPIDICAQAVNQTSRIIKRTHPKTKIDGIVSDYSDFFKRGTLPNGVMNFVMMLGSTIGNLGWQDAIDFLKQVQSRLNANDLLLIGFDMIKDPALLNAAYNDRQGITSEFNYNLLRRVNEELGGHFEVKDFKHYGFYNPSKEAMESHLLSLKEQNVFISDIKRAFHFDKLEPIQVEHSYKYSLAKIHKLARFSGFQVVTNFTDSQEYFVSSVWAPMHENALRKVSYLGRAE